MYERIADKITKFVLDLLKKEKMLGMDLDGETRPGNLSKYAGRSTYDSEWANKEIKKVFGYVNKKSKTYDPVFANEIKRIAPDWFVQKSPTPRKAINMYERMVEYVNKKSKTYDPVFANEIKRIAPDWFQTL
jgi:hypothetical protein